jgi:hypothetical protein
MAAILARVPMPCTRVAILRLKWSLKHEVVKKGEVRRGERRLFATVWMLINPTASYSSASTCTFATLV